jgi:CubicO group peptidase (beta-lactamase class C family)
MGEPNVPAAMLAQKYALTWTGGSSYAFVADSSYVPPKMLMPAGGSGGIFTNIRDNAKFMRMWLAQHAPNDPVTHAPILTTAQLASAQTPQITTASGTVPPGCGGFSANNASYSSCMDAERFGVNWVVADRPAGCAAGAGCNYIWHDGSTGEWGSMTKLSIAAKMGATVLIATDPYPTAPAGDMQPPNVLTSFASDLAGTMLDSGRASDAESSWWAQPLANTIARVLWLSGAPTSDASALEAQVTSTFLSGLGSQSITAYVQAHLQPVGACDTFRVLGATTDHVTVRFHCASGQNDMTLYPDGTSPYHIDRITSQAVTQQPF